jgi:hypothetical protein
MIACRKKSRPQASWFLAMRRSAMLLLGVLMLTTAGCRGCQSTQTAEEDGQTAEEKLKELAEREKKEKDDFEIGPLLPLFGQDLSEDELADRNPSILVKPGHWTPTVQKMQANYEDFVGQASTTLVDGGQRPAALRRTHFTFQSTRPVVLAKGREKMVEGQLYVPEDGASSSIRSRLTNRDSGIDIRPALLKLIKMPSYQYQLVVLAKEVSRYGYLKVTDTVRAPWEEEYDAASQIHYRVVLSDATKRIDLPHGLFSWTSIAYLVWDEVDATRLTLEQQKAMVDWIHWGGRLIVNGPDSLDTLRGSFLEEYLPAKSTGTWNISAEDLRGWSSYWAKRTDGKQLPSLTPVKPLSGVKLSPREGAREVAGGGGLFYECNVGRGSIVVSALQLSQRDLINWSGYDGFLNAGLLGRPPRKFFEKEYSGLNINWFEYPNRRLDAHLTTGLRLFARDAGTKANFHEAQPTNNSQFAQQAGPVLKPDRPGGLGAWSEFGPVSNAARETLIEAAGVEMPGAGFILGCLALYLVVLVPLNWMVFHTLGRVEWAWIAAPVIAVLGTFAIVRMAQLDIGFVRSHTEIALLELHGDHPRGLLSRYSAFYSSLSTTYDVTFDQANTVATPFPVGEEDNKKLGDRLFEVSFDRRADTMLRGLAVSSNSTRMMHAEQMFDLEGPLKLGKSSRNDQQVENHSGLDLRNVAVVHRFFKKDSDQPSYNACLIGDLRHGKSAVLGFTPLDLSSQKLPFAKERAQEARGDRSERMNVDQLLRLVYQFPQDHDLRYAHREEYRLVGQIDAVLPGAEAAPTASQVQGVTVVLAHLEYGDPPPAKPDANSVDDVEVTKVELFDD